MKKQTKEEVSEKICVFDIVFDKKGEPKTVHSKINGLNKMEVANFVLNIIKQLDLEPLILMGMLEARKTAQKKSKK